MSMYEKIVKILESYPGQKLTALEIAKELIAVDSEIQARRNNYQNDKDFLAQLRSEILPAVQSRNKTLSAKNLSQEICVDKIQKPQVCFINSNHVSVANVVPTSSNISNNPAVVISSHDTPNYLYNAVLEFLKSKPNDSFTAKEIAEEIVKIDDNFKNFKNASPSKLIREISASIQSRINLKNKRLSKNGKALEILSLNSFSPQKYILNKTNNVLAVQNVSQSSVNHQSSVNQQNHAVVISSQVSSSTQISSVPSVVNSTNSPVQVVKKGFSEHDLYPVLMKWLMEEQRIYCRRIDENKSSNSLGKGGNYWRHPDIVGLEDVTADWHQYVKECSVLFNFPQARLYSFEVKKELTLSNVRECFFQALSNSSWANEGYLVAAGISETKKGSVNNELRELSDDYGIGVIILDYYQVEKSHILFPAKRKEEINWRAIDRVVSENYDFKNYIDLVAAFRKVGKIYESEWNK
jgi:hypothetical protein